MSKFNPLSGAIRFALVAGTAALVAAPAYAQEEETPTSLDQIVVTGSRIQSQTVTASAPVTEIQREDFALSGATRVDDLVNQYPQLNPAFDSQENNGATGYATVSLRNLGPERTLTLVNGRRLPPGPTGELRDISIIPAALINRVDILTGGASAVYGSDAVAGVVNFVLDTEFEGFSINAGYSAYQHDNRNSYMQGLQDESGFEYEDGNSGFDGASRNLDLAWGGAIGDGSGHAMAWVTYRENDPLFHAQRDYSSCALDATGTFCGGSATSDTGNFVVSQAGVRNGAFASFDSTGRWSNGVRNLYNYAPPNYYQRPDERYTAGTAISYEVNEYFTPYFEAMLVNRKDSIQIAESGAFNVGLTGQSCANPIFGSLCADLGLNPDLPFNVGVLRRNVEGGPRITRTSDFSYRFVVGAKGALGEIWNYDASYTFARTSNDTQGSNDFLISRIRSGLLGCPAGSFAGCQFWNVWRDGGATAEAANALAGTSFNKTDTEMEVFNAFATGDLGFGLPWAGGSTIFSVFGVEHRREAFSSVSDNDSAAGNFAGAGAAQPPIDGQTKVNEVFMEALVPLFAGDGAFRSLDLDLGYRYSDYDRAGGANTYKIGLIGEIGMVRPRVGYNRAIRAPGINNLFSLQRTALYAGADPCAGPVSASTGLVSSGRTPEECARTGVTAAQYGNILNNPAGQNNQFIGGNPNLEPEQADTYTVGLVVTPTDDLSIALDYYNIQIEDTITGIGAPTILRTCLDTGLASICDLIQRGPDGDLWQADSNFVVNTTQNFGELSTNGVDLNVNYTFEALGGRFFTNFVGTYILEQEVSPLPGVPNTAFDCAGLINESCRTQDWRHIANVRYSRDSWSLNLRWRHFGAIDYVSVDGEPLEDDLLLAERGGIGSYNYLDLSGSLALADNIDLTLGINNIVDKEPPLVGVDNATNANAPGGYDQLGRFIFSSINVRF
ncbi:TonB-dependent receptor domain-containing protein [Aquimonas voraii]|uniref:TonB-dependent Receptor Plug Domain n=1 Tax=Aquimonas voraii TaxID=265719 RepID=A0A1G6ZF72_9GAMM|nr:TonB-dependent receptor [Aquimonas voraii]SDE00366.1 TonB-dependent Receptor Plug Domain [Aquimonas voraii]